jgi:hypothetical protein
LIFDQLERYGDQICGNEMMGHRNASDLLGGRVPVVAACAIAASKITVS